MTPYEAAALFVAFAEAAQTGFANYIAILSGMLAASWFFAHRLTRLMAAILIFIFTVAAAGFGNEVFSLYSDMARLGNYLNEIGQAPEAGLGWLGPVRGPAGAMTPIPYVVLSLCLMGYVAALWFFFQVRRIRREEEADA